MTRVELANVPPDAPMSKSIIDMPDEQWARMCAVHPASDVPIVRTVTTTFDGSRIIVDAHRGGTVIVWHELPPTPTCPICDGAHRGADCTDPACRGGRVTGLPAR